MRKGRGRGGRSGKGGETKPIRRAECSTTAGATLQKNKSRAQVWEQVFPDQDSGYLIAVLAEENLLVSTEITDTQVKQQL